MKYKFPTKPETHKTWFPYKTLIKIDYEKNILKTKQLKISI